MQKTGVGTTRHCSFAVMGMEVEERIEEWKERESLKIDVYERKKMPMITDVKGAFSIKSEGKKTLLVGSFDYTMTNFLGELLNILMMKNMNTKAWVTFLAGIKH